jgi:hypothetical protein
MSFKFEVFFTVCSLEKSIGKKSRTAVGRDIQLSDKRLLGESLVRAFEFL